MVDWMYDRQSRKAIHIGRHLRIQVHRLLESSVFHARLSSASPITVLRTKGVTHSHVEDGNEQVLAVLLHERETIMAQCEDETIELRHADVWEVCK